MTHHKQESGFTLVELMLAMAFLGSMMMLLSVTFMQIMTIYNKGATVKQVSSAARTFVDDLSRASNSGRAADFSSYTNLAGNATCLRLGSAIYFWNIADPASASGYKASSYTYPGTGNPPLNFVRTTSAELPSMASCPAGLAGIDRTKVSPLVDDGVRVYGATIKRLTDTNAVRVQVQLGTYGGVNSPYNPTLSPLGGWTCGASTVGNYCSFATIETVLYLPNGGN